MKNRFFKDKRVFVSGASTGLGRELAHQLVRAGAKVFAIARSEERLLDLQRKIVTEEGEIEIKPCDVTQKEEVLRLLRGREIEIAILNAGIKEQGEEIFSLEKYLKTFETNLLGTLYCLEGVLPTMIKRNEGQVVLISSLGGYHGMTHSFGYNASKAALSNLGDSLRMDLLKKRSRVGVTVVKPGLIATQMIPQNGLSGFLAVRASRAAQKILKGIAKKKAQVVFPRTFYGLTLFTAALPKGLQGRLLTRAKA